MVERAYTRVYRKAEPSECFDFSPRRVSPRDDTNILRGSNDRRFSLAETPSLQWSNGYVHLLIRRRLRKYYAGRRGERDTFVRTNKPTRAVKTENKRRDVRYATWICNGVTICAEKHVGRTICEPPVRRNSTGEREQWLGPFGGRASGQTREGMAARRTFRRWPTNRSWIT